MNLSDVERGAAIARAEAAEQIADLECRLAEAQAEIEDLRLALARIKVLSAEHLGRPRP
jgi:uncharacterized coiled-coil protein SlyX